MALATLNGFIRRDINLDRPLRIRLNATSEGPMPWDSVPPIDIRDARCLQNTRSESAFFADHGFVLLDHISAVKDWDSGPDSPVNDIALTYLPEIERLIRTRLLPGFMLEIEQGEQILRRGPGTPNPFYAKGVHGDYGLTADDYQESVEAYTTPDTGRAWRRRFDRPEVAGFMVINFWRTVYMDGPLQHLPLAVCDPNSVAASDLVPSALVGFTLSGKPSNQLALHHNAAQDWYFYPGMTTGEVLSFKVFETFKDGRRPGLQTCFHSAFVDPSAPDDAAQRQSCEHRVGVFIMNEQ